MATRTLAELTSDISTLLADNAAGDISAGDLRTIAQNLADSLAFVADLATVATSGAYSDLTGAPSIPSAPGDVGAATAAQGALADSAVQPAGISGFVTGTGITAIEAITLAAHAALSPPDTDTLYVCIG